MTTFHVLGTLDLRDSEGRHLGSPLSGSKRLALLAYLALTADRGLSRRDTLLGLFWPERDQRHARNALSNMLHQIRGSLGPDTLIARGHHAVGLAPGKIWCDATAFQEALAEDRLADALELYRGDLLHGFFVPGGSAEFDHWMDAERSRLRRSASEAAEALTARAEAEGDTREAIRWARTVVRLDPFDEPRVRRLILLLLEAGDRAGALREYEELERRLTREFEAEPAAETRAVVAGIRGRRAGAERPLPGSSTGPAAGASAGGGASDLLPPHAIAVLPFENLSGTADTEPFAVGLHDDLLTELSRISALSVIARSSVLRYRGTAKGVAEVARELGVGTVIQGGVQSSGDRLRLNVQMVDGRTGAHRWAERYDRELSAQGIFDLQSELAEKIAGALRAEFTPAEREQTGREPPEDLQAYRLYVQGRALLDQRTRNGMHRSLEHFQRAVELEPGYALAWAGLADGLSLLRDYEYEPAERVLPRASEAVRRALELGPTLAEAYTSLGEYHVARRDAPSAVEALRQAIELRASYAEAHNWLSWMSMVMGDSRQALESARRAVELDPLSPEVVSNVALSSLANGDLPTALREARRTRELHPDWTTGLFYEALALYHLGRPAEAMPILRGLTVEWAGSGPRLTLALSLIAAGEHEEARAMLPDFQEAGDYFSVGMIELASREKTSAAEAFRRVDRWDYWPTLAMQYFYPDVLRPFRGDPLHARMMSDMEAAWGPKQDGTDALPAAPFT